MRTMLRRPILAFALGLALAVAAFAGTAAYGALTDQTVTACYAPKTGALSVVGRDGAPDKCAEGTLPISWSERGPQGFQGPVGPAGPAGTFAGTFTSPNGAYSISVTNAGIVLSGPGSTVRLSGPSVSVDSAGPDDGARRRRAAERRRGLRTDHARGRRRPGTGARRLHHRRDRIGHGLRRLSGRRRPLSRRAPPAAAAPDMSRPATAGACGRRVTLSAHPVTHT